MFTAIGADARTVAALFWSLLRFPPADGDEMQDEYEEIAVINAHLIPSTERQKHFCLTYHLSQVDFDLHWGYVNRPVRKWFPLQLYFWEPQSMPGHTVMMGNSSDGYQHASNLASEQTPWQFTFSSIRDVPNESPFCMFDYFRDYRQIARHLGAGYSTEDRKPIFCQDGPIQTFENPEYYKRRTIQSRLDREIITEYLQNLGYDITQDEFWTSNKPAWVVWTDLEGKIREPQKRLPG